MDLIRSGKAPDVIRRKGARGELPLAAEDQIEILAVIATASDAEIGAQALATLKAWDAAEVLRVMANPQTAPDVLRFGAEHIAIHRDDLRAALLHNATLPVDSFIRLHRTISASPSESGSPDSIRDTAMNSQPEMGSAPPAPTETSPPAHGQPEPVHVTDETAVEILARVAAGANIEEVTGVAVETPPEATMRDDELTAKDRETLIEKISRMSVVEKIKAALTGNMETRVLLIRDSNKIISRAVLQSPKISDTEAESYAAAKNVSEEVLRLIAASRKFMKSYTVLRALVNNPRAPIDITMPLLIRINEKDLKGLALNRNVPEVIRSLSIKMIKQREDAGKVNLRRS